MSFEDRYQIRLLGKIKKGADLKQTIDFLAERFKLPRKSFEQCFDGRPRTVKQGISLEKARKHLALFEKAGAQAEIDISPDKRILAKATIMTGQAEHGEAEEENTATTGRTLTFERYFLNPLIFSCPYSVPISDGAGAESGSIESDYPAFGWFLILFLSVFLAHEIHGFMLRTLVSLGISNIPMIIGCIALFLSLLLGLPKILNPGKCVSVFSTKAGERFLLCRFRELRTGTCLTRTFAVEDSHGQPAARIKRNIPLSIYSCKDILGGIIFSVDIEAEKSIDDSALILGGTLREKLVDLGFIGEIILSRIDPEGTCNKLIIRDANEIAVGEFRRGKTCTLKVYGESTPNPDALAAFAIVLAGF